MKFIHIADVHLGASPDVGNKNGERAKEIWDTFVDILHTCEEEKIEVLLIAGDLFHRQPLLRELKEVRYLFSELSKTKVFLIVSESDYLQEDLYYHDFAWSSNVYPLMGKELECVEIPELGLCVYGLSYWEKEITEDKYENAKAYGRQPYEILLAHGGDKKHIPLQRDKLIDLGYNYIAMGHLHMPKEVLPNFAAYAGSLEPLRPDETGKHGYIRGEFTPKGVESHFVPCAKREYIKETIEVNAEMKVPDLIDKICEIISLNGQENYYLFTLTGERGRDVVFEKQQFLPCGNIIDWVDHTRPDYDMERIMEENEENLLGKFVKSFYGAEPESREEKALYEGVQALLKLKRG